MNKKILIGEVIIAMAIVLGFKLGSRDSAELKVAVGKKVYNNKVLQCSPDWNTINTDSLANTIVPLPGWGNYRLHIITKNDSSQYYFQQGINMYYAFHIIEAMASFKKANTFDSTNPMIHWATALTFGPNINDFEYKASPEALEYAKSALSFSANSSSKEKALINAMQVRYSDDSTISRTSLNAAYSNAMGSAYKQYPGDPDISTLYADALMLQHPWDYWKHNGESQQWTQGILNVLEKVLLKNPGHPGANHYYIHMVEASPNPARALPSAGRLGKMMPMVSHMIHMPSHIYIRTGNYSEGIKVNKESITGYNTYLSLYKEVVNNSPLYLIHNVHMQTACAMMQPDYSFSIKSANECINSFDSSFLSWPQPAGNWMQYVYMSPQFVNVRYGKWNEILSAPSLSKNYVYGYVLSEWAKGMAFANTSQLKKARETLLSMQEGMQSTDLLIVLKPFNAAISSAKVAEKILQGTIEEKEKHLNNAISFYKEAVRLEDSLIYTEPRDWLIPSRHYLANAQLMKKNYVAAKKTLEEDLEQNPLNFYALFGLQEALLKKKELAGYRKINKQFKLAYAKSDLTKPGLVY